MQVQTLTFVFIGGLILLNIHARGQPNPTAAVPMVPKTKAARSWLVLHIVNKSPVIRLGEYPRIGISIKNGSRKAVSLIQPDEGSDAGWRTPIVGWSIISANHLKTKHPIKPIPATRQCGVMNGTLIVHSIAPGKHWELDGWSFPLDRLEQPGRYRVVFYYINDTVTEFERSPRKAPPSTVHSSGSNLLVEFGITGLRPYSVPNAQALIRRSTLCALRSNEILLTVLPPAARPTK